MFLRVIITVILITVITSCKAPHKEDSAQYILTDENVVTLEEIILKERDTAVVLLDSIRIGEGPFNVMERLKIDRKVRQKILYALANEADLTTLRLGEKFGAVYNSDTSQILEFIYFQDIITTHRIKLIYENGKVETEHILDEKPHKIRHRLIKDTLYSPTLDAQFREMGLPVLIAQTAMNVLECKISFRTDARIGDRFELLVQETVYEDTINGETVEQILPGRAEVLFVSYSGERVKTHRGYKFFDGDKSSHNAHYTEDGEALIYSGLRYPLDRIHITSSYGYRRHPVTGSRSMHHGVDYRANTGTLVYAVAEGKVVKSTYDDMSGHYIAIRHKDNTASYYLHLSKRSVGVGTHVKARQVIGQSGNTGASSGPHLHFGFKQPNGKWMNPLSKRMIATPKLSGEKLEKLKIQIEEIRRIYSELDI